MSLALVAALLLAALAPPAGAQTTTEPLATCFWEGPISMKRPTSRGFDGRSFNFPEESATYWMARLRLPAGAKLILRGKYAKARYISLNAYSDGAPTDALADTLIAPDAGSVNPFLTGARRDGDKRDYTVTVVDEPPPGGAARQPNTLYARPDGNAAIEVFLRVYEPDRGLDLDGGVGLPAAELVRADGSVLRGAEACAAVNDPDRSIPVQTIQPELWNGGRSAPGCARTNPAFDPIRWERFFNINYAQQAVIQDCTAAGRDARRATPAAEQGGFYSNRDNAYVYAHLSQKFGPVVVLWARLPTVPRTFDAERTMEGGELRYWSLCTGQSRVTTRTPDCVADREVPVDGERIFTAVISRVADRPANATARCGVAWVDWGDQGDGAGDGDYGLLIIRNMLPAPGFGPAIQRIGRAGDEQRVMGPQFPDAKYSSREAFEKRGCRAAEVTLGAGDALRRSTRTGRIGVPLTCTTAEATCAGTLAIRAGRKLRRVPFSLPAGATRTLTTRIPKRSRRARVAAEGRTPVGVRLTATRTYSVR